MHRVIADSTPLIVLYEIGRFSDFYNLFGQTGGNYVYRGLPAA